MRVKAGLDRPHGNKTSNQQAGTDQQDKRQRYFAHDQERASLGFSRHGAHIAARGLKRGNQAEQNACGERQKQREADDSPVGGDAGLAHARDIAEIQSQKRADSGDAEDQPKDSSGEREDDAFGEQLTDEAGAPSADGDADQQQIRDAGAGDQQNEADGDGENQQRRSDVAVEDILDGLGHEHDARQSGADAGPSAAELVGGELKLRLDRAGRDAGADTGGDTEVVALIRGGRIELKRHPEVDGARRFGFHVGAGDADDDVRTAVEGNGLAEHRRAGKCALPESVAEDGEVARMGPVLVGGKTTALGDGDAEEPEIISGNLRHLHLLRRVDCGEVHGAVAVSGNILKQGGLFAPEVKSSGRASDGRSVGARGTEDDDSVRVRRGDGFQEDPVDDGEDGGVGSMPSASAARAMRVNPGLRRKVRRECLRSFKEGVHTLSSLDEVEEKLSSGFSP